MTKTTNESSQTPACQYRSSALAFTLDGEANPRVAHLAQGKAAAGPRITIGTLPGCAREGPLDDEQGKRLVQELHRQPLVLVPSDWGQWIGTTWSGANGSILELEAPEAFGWMRAGA